MEEFKKEVMKTYQDTLKIKRSRGNPVCDAVAEKMKIPKSVVRCVCEENRKKSNVKNQNDDQKNVYDAVCKLQDEKCKEEKIFEKVSKSLSLTGFKTRDFYSSALHDLAKEVCNMIMIAEIFFY